jgi:hypothetical protein
MIFVCAACSAKLRVPRAAAGKSIRCPKCKAVSSAPPAEPEPIAEPASAEIVEEADVSPVRPSSRRAVETARPYRRAQEESREDSRQELNERPAIVTTVVVFHFIAAFLFFAVFVLGMLLQVPRFMDGVVHGAEEARQSNLDLYQAISAQVDKGMPGHRVLLIVDAVLCLAFAVLLVVSAVGLLHMRRWGRTLSLIFSSAALARGLVGILYALIFVLPTINTVTQHVLDQDLGKDAAVRRVSTITKTLVIILPSVGMIYPLLSLLALARSSVGERLLPAKREVREERRGRSPRTREPDSD